MSASARRNGQAQPCTSWKVAPPCRQLTCTSSSSGIHCAAPSPIPSSAMATSMAPRASPERHPFDSGPRARTTAASRHTE